MRQIVNKFVINNTNLFDNCLIAFHLCFGIGFMRTEGRSSSTVSALLSARSILSKFSVLCAASKLKNNNSNYIYERME